MQHPVKYQRVYYDPLLLLPAIALLALGLLMVASASMVISDRQFGYPFHFLSRQLLFLVVGVMLSVLVTRISMVFWQKIGGYLIVGCLLLLLIVLIPGVGKEVNGSIRWIGLGPFSLQVSELTKLAMVIYLAGYLVRRQKEVEARMRGFLKPLILLALIALLLLQEPDFGATTVIAATTLGMLFVAGVRLWQFWVLLIGSISTLGFLAVATPYRLIRLTTFLHPWANQFDTGYQLTQSLIAFGRGGVWGVGLGNSIQKLFYLPEAHTDFLFAVIAEELGLIGEFAVIALFACLVGRILSLGYQAIRAQQPFHGYVAWGLGLQLALQTMINIGVNSGILPTKGLTLPLMSYGGSSIMMSCIELAILLRIAHEISHAPRIMPATTPLIPRRAIA